MNLKTAKIKASKLALKHGQKTVVYIGRRNIHHVQFHRLKKHGNIITIIPEPGLQKVVVYKKDGIDEKGKKTEIIETILKSSIEKNKGKSEKKTSELQKKSAPEKKS